jgi:cytochrome c-type biogenesis protein CcmH/NrfG
VSFWRNKVIEPVLDHETQLHIDEQREWIAREPSNPEPYYNLAQLYRMQWKPDDALGLLLEAVRLSANYADAHAALAEMYAIRADYPAAWRHARTAEGLGERRGVELLERYRIPE